ncbi:MAG: hypothetical protein H6745_08565 [Deltaproteobacteria bacterium]|nr:hypothetical protein [Deltaproteobacteria bacterium]
MLAALTALLLLAAPAPAPPELTSRPPRCPAAADLCFGLVVHVATDPDGRLAQDADWLAEQVAAANDRFAPMGVGFEVDAAELLGPEAWHVADRAARDALGRAPHKNPGRVDVFITARLENVDEPGEIRGVHWRDRRRRADRWIILSAIAPRHVLAHELGHYFGLPHTLALGSLMNTSGNDPTPREERRFLPAEERRVAARAKALAKRRELVPRPR